MRPYKWLPVQSRPLMKFRFEQRRHADVAQRWATRGRHCAWSWGRNVLVGLTFAACAPSLPPPERAAADLEGEEGSLNAQIARANEAIGETRLQILGVGRDTQAEVAEQLRQVQVQLNELQPRLAASRDQLARALVRAPASGQVVGLTVFTEGGVVQPGQTLMEIVPAEASLVIEARVAPPDADDLELGQRTEVRFTAFRDRALPILRGEVTGISADSFTDERTGEAYFRATVIVPPEELARIGVGPDEATALRPGLPVEVVVPQRKRTALQYFIEPLTRNLWRSFREG